MSIEFLKDIMKVWVCLLTALLFIFFLGLAIAFVLNFTFKTANAGIDWKMTSDKDLLRWKDDKWTSASYLEDDLYSLFGAIQQKQPFDLRAKIVLRDLRSYDLAQLMAETYLIPYMQELRENPKPTAKKIFGLLEGGKVLIFAADAFNQIKGSSPIGIPPSEMVTNFYMDVTEELENIEKGNGDNLAIPRVLKYLDFKIADIKRQYTNALEVMSLEDGNRLLELAKESNFEEAERIVNKSIAIVKRGSSWYCGSIPL